MKHVIRTTDELGSVIRTERKALGLTQSDLAGACGLSLRFVSELERGRPSVGISRVLRVLEMLGLGMVIESPKNGQGP